MPLPLFVLPMLKIGAEAAAFYGIQKGIDSMLGDDSAVGDMASGLGTGAIALGAGTASYDKNAKNLFSRTEIERMFTHPETGNMISEAEWSKLGMPMEEYKATRKKISGKLKISKPGKATILFAGLPIGAGIISAMMRDKVSVKPNEKGSNDSNTNSIVAKVNPDVTDEAIKSNIDLLRDSIKRTEDEANKTIAPLLNIANGYLSPTALSGINMNRVNTLVDTYKQKSVDAAAMAAIGSLYVMSGQQGGLDMVKTGTLLSSEMMGKWKNLLSTQDVLRNGTAEQKKVASVMIHNELGELEAMGVSNKDALGALEAAMNVKSKYDLQIEQLKINIEKLGSMKGKGAVDENGNTVMTPATNSNNIKAVLAGLRDDRKNLDIQAYKDGTNKTKAYKDARAKLTALIDGAYKELYPQGFAGSKGYGEKPTFSAEQIAMIKG